MTGRFEVQAFHNLSQGWVTPWLPFETAEQASKFMKKVSGAKEYRVMDTETGQVKASTRKPIMKYLRIAASLPFMIAGIPGVVLFEIGKWILGNEEVDAYTNFINQLENQK